MSQLQTHPADVGGFPNPETAPEPEDWWSNCTTADLKTMVGAGIAAGDRFMIASREIERRALEARMKAESIASENTMRAKWQVRGLGLAFVGGGMLLTLFFLWMGGGN